MSEVIDADDVERARQQVTAALRSGELAVLPTDTVYGVVADVFQRAATGRLYSLKRRSRYVPLPVLVRSVRQLSGLVEGIPEPAERLMTSYWPGPLTLILRTVEGLTWDLGESRGTVAVRMPADELTVEVVGDVGPLACTGARLAGLPEPVTCAQAQEQLGEHVRVYVDGGERPGPPSTVVDLTRDELEVLRVGGVSAEHVHAVASGEVAWGQRPQEEEGAPGADRHRE